jgi:hypothetical protein
MMFFLSSVSILGQNLVILRCLRLGLLRRLSLQFCLSLHLIMVGGASDLTLGLQLFHDALVLPAGLMCQTAN